MTLYLDSLCSLLPEKLRSPLDHALVPEVKSTVEAILRLAVGACAPENCTVPGWEDLQHRAVELIGQLKRGEHEVTHKRRREPEDEHSTTKRARTDSSDAIETDHPAYSLHALSVSSPIRKKVNITVHRTSIRLTNPSTQHEEYAPIPLDALQRVLLLSTRGKSKPHWTIALLASDTPAPTGKAADTTKDAPIPQLVFGLDATLTAPLTTTSYDSSGSPKTETYPKGSPSLPALRAFLSHIPVPTIEPSTSIFRAATAQAAQTSSSDGVAGVEAYRGAKQGALWFLREGVFWDGKPCEFFALEHLARASKGGGEQAAAYDGVRTLSATGRTCSVILRRRRRTAAHAKDGGDDEEEEEDVEDIDFGMVDGREQEPIGRWIKAHRHLFGRPTVEGEKQTVTQADAKGKAKANDPRAEDTEDEEDSDFTMDSDEEEESSGEESGSDASADGTDGEGEDEEGDASDDVTGDEAEEEELDPKNHPLLRPGAMPRMSRAAVEAVVGMVEQDLMGGGRAAQAEDESEEEDELED
ncbi:hypothetical protein C8Q77DRAFT_1118840 [Trametes polyzona]|nr:hypothetical protein C8Q77DRAFT_1118840 [Trametes polyzona]